jgi:hypothetical protein|tara:strand:+ start:287 stop:670 length:384 start_codon:yes stop_codon:yes gene_type:complete
MKANMSNFIKSTNVHTPDWTSPERRLFIAVLSQAVHDAFSSHVSGLEKRQAQAWLTSNSRDFKEICELSGRNSKYVLTKIRRRILEANGWNVDISMRTTPPRIRKYKQKHLTGNAYYAAKREKRASA